MTSDVAGVPAPRPNVLAVPAASVARFAMVAIVLLVTGAFAGSWLHLETARDRYLDRAVLCAQEAERLTAGLTGLDAQLTRIRSEDACRADAERQRAAYMLGGVLAAAAGGTAIVLLSPWLRERRRRLRPLGPAAAPAVDRMGRLAADMKVRRPPQLRLRPGAGGDAFCYGWPGDFRVAVPTGLLAAALSDRPLFDAALCHELAHLRHGDVMWSRLARSAWYVLAPMLVLPAVIAALVLDPSLLPGYVWRAAVLAVVAHLVILATLRAREYDADLAAADGGPGPAAVRAFVARTRESAVEKRPWGRLLSLHPTRRDRLAVLDRPERAATPRFIDGLVAGFLAATALPLLAEMVWTALSGTPAQPLVHAAEAVLAGVLLGTVIGLDVIRSALAGRAVGVPPRTLTVALGAGLGVSLGRLTSLGNVVADFGQPLWLLVPLAFTTGATLVVAAVAGLLTDAAGRARTSRPIWLPVVAVGIAVYGAAVWISGQAQLLAEALGPDSVLAWAVTAMPAPLLLLALTVATLVVLAAMAAGGSAGAPAWLAPSSVAERWAPARERAFTSIGVGLTAGVTGAVVLVANWIVRGPAPTEAAASTRYYGAVWIAAVAAATATAALCLASAERGPALATVAGPVAVLGVVAGILFINLADGYLPTALELATFAESGFVLGAALSLLAANLAAIGHRGASLPIGWAAAGTVPLTAVAAAILAVAPGLVVPPL